MNVRDPGVPTVRSPADLLAVVPYLLGFHPTDSVIVLALTGSRITFLACGDLPTPGTSRAAIGDIVDYLAAVTARQQATGTILIGYGPPQQVTPIIDLARQIFPRHGLAVHEALRITDGRYFSYLCNDPACCPPDGVVVDPASSPSQHTPSSPGSRHSPTARRWPPR